MNISEMTDTELTDYAELLWSKIPFPEDMGLWEQKSLRDVIAKVEWEIYRRGMQ
jgi:hypothetical protein